MNARSASVVAVAAMYWMIRTPDAFAEPVIPSQTISVAQYGALGNYKSDDTSSIHKEPRDPAQR